MTLGKAGTGPVSSHPGGQCFACWSSFSFVTRLTGYDVSILEHCCRHLLRTTSRASRIASSVFTVLEPWAWSIQSCPKPMRPPSTAQVHHPFKRTRLERYPRSKRPRTPWTCTGIGFSRFPGSETPQHNRSCEPASRRELSPFGLVLLPTHPCTLYVHGSYELH